MSHRDSTDHARETSLSLRGFKGMVRRLLLTLTDATSSWQVKGVYGSTAGDEIFTAELFPGIGIFARPPDQQGAEAVMVAPAGNPKAGVLIATRDEATRKLVASQVGPGETCVYNAVSMVIVKSDGTILAKSINGATLQLATSQALTVIFNAISGAAVVAGDGGASFKAAIVAALNTNGFLAKVTTKLRGE